MQITATEFKNNLGSYLEKASSETVVVTQYGKPIAKVVGIDSGRSVVDELFGSMPASPTPEEALAMRAAEA